MYCFIWVSYWLYKYKVGISIQDISEKKVPDIYNFSEKEKILVERFVVCYKVILL